MRKYSNLVKDTRTAHYWKMAKVSWTDIVVDWSRQQRV